MRQARRWASVALSGLVAASLCLAAPGPARAASGGTEVLDWNVSESVEAGGIYSIDERGSSKFNEYRDMDNGFVGELSLRGEKKDQPYFFELGAKNPARDDQAYEAEFGRYGMFRLELGWDRVRHVLSNNAQTIFQENGGNFTLPATLRNTITTTPAGYVAPTAANCTGITSWTCPYPVGTTNSITVGNAQYNFINGTIDGLLRPVDLGFNTDVGFVGLKLTPTEALRFDFEYSNRRSEGHRALGVQFSSIPAELAIPIDSRTHEAKFGAEFARPAYAIQFNYTASIFENEYQSYTWDNPLSTVTQSGRITAIGGTVTRTAASATGEISAPPNNTAHTFNLTGRGSLPRWRTNISGAFSYTMLRQDETFLNNVAVDGTQLTPRNTDDAGMNSPDAKADLVSGNILLTSRPFNSVTATARYRYFEYQNDTPAHTFTNTFAPTGVLWLNAATGRYHYLSPTATNLADAASKGERFTKQNAGIDLGWRPIRQVSLKGGYEYEHWNRGDFDGKSFATVENSAKAAVDVTPIDWLLGRATYTYGVRNLGADYGRDPLSGPGFYKFNYADRVRNRVDLLLQFSLWETFTPSFTFGYANDDYNNSAFALTDDKNLNAGVSLGWSPMGWLTLSADYTYERHDSTQRVPGGTTGSHVNDFESKSKDEFHTVGVGAIVDVIPKKFDINLGYGVTFGYTTIKASNLNPAFTTSASNFDGIQNVLQTVKIVGRYRLTEKLSVRGGFAYERYEEGNFARDPMQPFMGYRDTSNTGIQSVWLGATTPNYESYTMAAFVRYEF